MVTQSEKRAKMKQFFPINLLILLTVLFKPTAHDNDRKAACNAKGLWAANAFLIAEFVFSRERERE